MSTTGSTCIEHMHVAMHLVRPRTDGRTNEEPLLPTRDTSPSVTRGRAYENFLVWPPTRDMLREILASLDEDIVEAEIETHRVLSAARKHLAASEPDPDAARHLAEMFACALDGCLEPARDGEWCHAHHPDDVAIQRAMQGQKTPLLPHERAEVFRRLAAKGLTAAQISERVGANRKLILKALAS